MAGRLKHSILFYWKQITSVFSRKESTLKHPQTLQAYLMLKEEGFHRAFGPVIHSMSYQSHWYGVLPQKVANKHNPLYSLYKLNIFE